MLEVSKPDPVRSSLLDEAAANGIRHGYFTRSGGVSEGIYAGLNTGVGSRDEPDRVRENRRRVAAWMVEVLHAPDDAALTERVAREVAEMCAGFPVPGHVKEL